MAVISLRISERDLKGFNKLSQMVRKDQPAVLRKFLDYRWEFLMLRFYPQGKSCAPFGKLR